MKDLNKKSRTSIIRTKKQRLCNRIEQSKSLSELKGWEKTFSYHSVLKDDEDWDYIFLLDLIKEKLRRMRDYFWTHNVLENEHWHGDICNRLISLLNAAYINNIVLESDLDGIYVNTRNVHRFLSPKVLDFYTKNQNLKKYYLPTVRETKAKRLFWRYFEHHIEKLWE